MKMFKRNIVSAAVLAGFVVPGLASAAGDIDWDLYGSLRLGYEMVDADGATKDYDGFRDAYTRIGAKATYVIDEDWSVMGQLEVPFDIANMRLSHASYEDEKLRVGKLQVNSPYGSAWYGKGWLAYYNYITYPTDFFSSYYTGFQGNTFFRGEETFYYSSPRLAGFQFVYADVDRVELFSENYASRQYVLNYTNGGLSISAAIDDNKHNFVLATDGDDINRTEGVTVSYSTGPWYMAATYENEDRDSGDADTSKAFVSYQINEKNTIKGYLADSDNYGGNVYEIGFDHQYNDSTKFYADYYVEDEHSAIENDRDRAKWVGGTPDGGSVLMVGVRYDFASD